MKPIPDSMILNSGEQTRVTETIDDFFVRTKEFIEENYRTESLHWQIRSGEIAYDAEQITNDRITYLLYKDFIIAGVLASRTEFNYVRYTFFRNLNEFEKIAARI